MNRESIMHNVRTVIGFLLAPLVPAVPIAIFSDYFAALLMAIMGYPAVLVLGVPAYLILQMRAWLRWPAYVTAGFIVGALYKILYNVLSAVLEAEPWAELRFEVTRTLDQPLSMWLAVWSGGVGALTFWLIVRPDRHHSSSGFGGARIG
jgi:CBS-domain-containing membrane protein